jgi:hypothetical protein
MMPGDVPSATWELEGQVVSSPPDADLPGPQILGPPRRRFIYITWGVVGEADDFTMFRRAKLWLDAVPDETMREAVEGGLLVGRLGLSDDAGWPLCASVRPPLIAWAPRESS